MELRGRHGTASSRGSIRCDGPHQDRPKLPLQNQEKVVTGVNPCKRRMLVLTVLTVTIIILFSGVKPMSRSSKPKSSGEIKDYKVEFEKKSNEADVLHQVSL
jgi:hypothetical protein